MIILLNDFFFVKDNVILIFIVYGDEVYEM